MRRAAIYFLAGAVMDFIVCAYYTSISGRAIFLASVLAGLITVWSMFVISGIADERDDRLRRALLILSYALGNGVGTALAMMMN
jgi:hypothetical protein